MTPDWRKLAIAFLAGCLGGGFLGARAQRSAFHRFWQKGPNTERALQRMSRELGLAADQQQKVKAILDREHDAMMALHRDTSARWEGLRQSMRADIRAVLTPDQQEKFAAMTERWDARHRQLWGDAPAPAEPAAKPKQKGRRTQ